MILKDMTLDLTTVRWASLVTHVYVGVTAHCISDSWDLTVTSSGLKHVTKKVCFYFKLIQTLFLGEKSDSTCPNKLLHVEP